MGDHQRFIYHAHRSFPTTVSQVKIGCLRGTVRNLFSPRFIALDSFLVHSDPFKPLHVLGVTCTINTEKRAKPSMTADHPLLQRPCTLLYTRPPIYFRLIDHHTVLSFEMTPKIICTSNDVVAGLA